MTRARGNADDRAHDAEGIPGASAQREYERRRNQRRAAVHARHPRIGGLLLRLGQAPTHELVWAQGAEGERRVAAAIERSCGQGVELLYDRRIPGTRANLDLLAISTKGVWVIEAKSYRGKATVNKPLLGQAELTIGARRQNRLIAQLDRQVALVRAVVWALDAGVSVRGALCFVDTKLPLVGTLSVDGYELLRPRTMARRLRQSGGLDPHRVGQLANELAIRFPRA